MRFKNPFTLSLLCWFPLLIMVLWLLSFLWKSWKTLSLIWILIVSNGPDGFFGIFYKNCWNITVPDLLSAERHFFRTACFLLLLIQLLYPLSLRRITLYVSLIFVLLASTTFFWKFLLNFWLNRSYSPQNYFASTMCLH